jgi:serine/threonine protein phosphatase 1
MADIHGEYEKYKRLLKAIDLRESDTLYVLGDVLDCGAQSMEVLFDMMRRLNPFQRNRK